jgi:hypothetical protein
LVSLRNEGRATTGQISMAKRNNIAMAKQIISDARQMLGGMGITNEYPVMRHMMNLESVITYEGTHDIHLLDHRYGRNRIGCIQIIIDSIFSNLDTFRSDTKRKRASIEALFNDLSFCILWTS